MRKILSIIMLAFAVFACNQAPKIEIPKNLSFSDVQVEGDLQVRIQRNFNRMEETKYQPAHLYSDSKNDGWPGDAEGRTILALVLDAQASGRTPKYLDSLMDLYPKMVNAKGYFGEMLEGKASEQQLSSHGWVLRALCELYIWKKEDKILGYINKIVDNLALPTKGLHNEYPLDPEKRKGVGGVAGTTIGEEGKWFLSSDIGCDFIFLDGVIQAYQVTKREEIKPLIDEMIHLYLKVDLKAIQAQTHASLTGMRALLRYYQTNGDTSLLKAVEKRFALYKKEAMTENNENYNWFGKPWWTEPCAVIDSYIDAMWLWQITGRAEYLEDAHQIYYNGMCFEQHANGGFACNTCSGSKDCNLGIFVEESHWCCSMRGGEGLSRVAQYQAFQTDNSIMFPQFENGRFTFHFGKDSINIKESSLYPYAGKVYLDVESSHLQTDPEIRLFAPSWIDEPIIAVNGNIVKIEVKNQFLCFTYELKDGDLIEYTFKMKNQTFSMQNKNSIQAYHKFLYGPLLIGYVGKDSITLPKNIIFEPITKELFRLKDSKLLFTPVCHLMNPRVIQDKFKMQVLFKE
jgi:uncharacterized protein